MLLALTAVLVVPACNDNPDAYEIADGKPTVSYVRVPDVLSSDSLVTHAFMGTTIAIVGENMRSVKELWFNDRQAILNTSLITPTVLIVSVPNTIPDNVTNKMYLVNQKGDTVQYDFGVDVPAPLVSSMKCEYVAQGDEAIIKGNFFLPVDGAQTPEVYFTPNIKASEIVSFNLNEIRVKVPVGVTPGPVTIKSRYGATRSKFYFRDNRGLILDWDNLNAAGGWRAGVLSDSDPVQGVSGKYVRFKGKLDADGTSWDEDGFSFNLWGSANGRPQGDLFTIDPANAVIKFEINVPSAWTSAALQMVFTPWGTKDTNGYLGDGVTPRGLWIPWKQTGSYTTSGWETIILPLKNFIYLKDGTAKTLAGPGNWGGLTFFVWSGGDQAKGVACTPVICIDNIRVVPAE